MTKDTVKLKPGVEVLAKKYKGELCAVTYANRTQAEMKALGLGSRWTVHKGMGRPFYVRLKSDTEISPMWHPDFVAEVSK